ncbi:neutral/alkaline non-lysosomal ceramidase N-terminal domain-containing protein [Paludisphaera mucosa]|uniref:Neutral/alkaline non-lysosomal ceramidase N-terminal domain-containing protein n=1 Tax=Paludisphaera mucosa TaxID=3030827 RepID=A0ABT6F763_9BACT|nr:neutral/alkaline non-lysosomal ceramidase N-terminal domain-containing protein [Paludisphaera mucosa]MDG3003442.1 neutral/alkaline non-lysosomal ceramidase N-terminal domain-containing protein [Paludisphaera mucosa]
MTIRTAACVGLGLTLAAAAGAGRAEEVAVGVARVDVSPSGPIRLSGYLARTTESKGIGHPIYAKALAIGSDDQKPVILVSVDNVGVSDAIVGEIAERLERKVGLPRERLALGASHTHSAPLLTGVLPNIFGKPIAADQQAKIDAYTREFVDKIERVCLEALADRKPATLSWAQGKVGFAANRRTPGGPVDHSLPVLRATGPDGKIRAIVANYACHCTTLDPADNLVDGDWAGAAQRGIEADNPGCIALTVVGCGADSNPNPRRKSADAESHGRALADEVARLMRGEWKPVAGPPQAAMERFDLPYDTLPTRAELEKLVAAGGPRGHFATLQLAQIDRDGKLPAALPYSAQAWRFGDDLLMVFLPGEVVVDYVLRIKKEFDPSRTWVTAYANDVPCYIPSERILSEGGYEGGEAMTYYARPTRLKTGVEKLILDAVHRVAGAGFEPTRAKVAAKVDEENPPALTPAEALQTFHTKPGLKVELVAAEPLIESPVAVDFGADGKLWVCEMRDYPSGMDGKYKPGGRVRVLEDRDRDGRYETAATFIEDLPFPTGLMCWRKGVLICAAPQILYAEDSDGDGKADVRRTLYEGFATDNYQARVNGLAYAADGWVYGANGLIGGKIHGRADGREVDLGSRDFRFKPDLGVFEPASGITQQGRVHDDWGNQFGGNNSILIQHYPLADHDVRRNPRVSAPPPAVVPRGDADPGKLFPASHTLIRYNEPQNANRVTSASSPLVHRDPLLGDEYFGDGFACESVHNLVRRVVLEPEGVTFTGRRAADEQDREFLASTDSWFRPVQVRTGLDGALWVVDMYRFVIEHPRWISPERLATLDVRAGADKGRIYRIVPEGRPIRPVENLEAMPTARLAAALDTPNGTVRDTVQRLLDHRRDRAAKPILAAIARGSHTPAARAQALAALDVAGDLDDEVLAAALDDEHQGVRREAVRIAEPRLARNTSIGLKVIERADDADVRVRYQTALSLGAWPAPEAGRALGAIAARDGGDEWLRAAVLSSATPHARAVLERLIAAAGPDGPASDMVEPLIATIAGTRDRTSVAAALALIASGDAEPARWRLGAVAELLDAAGDEALAADRAVLPLMVAARRKAVDAEAPGDERVAALRLLGRTEASREADRAAIAGLLDPAEPGDVQSAALGALSRLGDAAAAEAILDRWARLGPAARAAALDALISREASETALIGALEAGRVASSQVGAEHRERLLRSGTEPLRKRAQAAFGALTIGARREVLAAYDSVKTSHGDPARGKAAFQRACAACHKLDGFGAEVGPDLAALTDLSADALLTAILDPNREVDARYVSYNAALKDGRTLSGLIANETASAITLKRQEGAADVVLRDDLEEIASSGRSLMPEGLENDLKPTDVADVVAYLSQGASRPKVQEGNRPEVVKAGPDGVIRLIAADAEIFGPNLLFETEHGNLGYWHAAADHAGWTFEVDHGAMFNVALEWACDDGSAGNAYMLKLGGQTIRGVVPGTGGWGRYVRASIANQVFHKGVHRIDLRPEGPMHGALADVRAIILTPGEAGDVNPAQAAEPTKPVDVARTILDPATADGDRQAFIDRLSGQSAPLIAALADGLDHADEAEQYRRIPWIWRVAIAAGKRDDGDELKRILEVALPADSPDAKLDDWRAVVLGGGLINGVSLSGPLPGPRFETILKDAPALKARWDRSIALASKMADDASVRTGTRYDALRMLGAEPWDRHGEHLARYLANGLDPELHQGAVSALADVSSARIVAPLLEALDRLTPDNRKFAVQALTREADRREALVEALASGRIRPDALDAEARKILVDPAQTQSAERARSLIAPGSEKTPQGAANLLPFDALQARLNDPALRILDARPKADYDKAHIPGAVWVDVKKAEALAAAPGGLQDARAWEAWIADLAIAPNAQVVVYDAERQLDAARLWWLLSYLGVPRVALIDGGYQLWERESRPTMGEAAKPAPSSFSVAFRKDRLATREDVAEVLKSGSARVVDARSEAEHTGEKVLSKRGGRIPGACPVEWTRLVDADGRFLAPDALREKLKAGGVKEGDAVVSHCQGGGRASVDAFVLERLGFPTRNYYLGWSEWGNAEDAPVETGPPTRE